MTGLRRLSDVALAGAAAGATSGQVPTLGTTGRFAPAAGPYDNPLYGLHTSSPLPFRYSRAALSRVRAGLDDFHIVAQGDSISDTGGGATRTDNYLRKAAAALATRTGLTARQGWIPVYTSATLNSEWTVGSGWSSSQNYLGSTHQGATGTVGGAGVLSFTPVDDSGTAIQTDSFDIIFHPASGGIQYAIDGGSYTNLANSTAGNTGSYNRVSVSTGGRGLHTLNIKAQGTGSAPFLAGAEAVDSQSRGIRYSIGGTSGSSTPTGTQDMGRVLKADLMIWEYGINDTGFQTALATFTTNVSALMAAQASWARPCDTLWLGWLPRSGGSSPIPESTYYGLLDSAADANGAAVLHYERLVGSFTVANAAPMSLMNDTLHPNTAGRQFMGAAIAGILGVL